MPRARLLFVVLFLLASGCLTGDPAESNPPTSNPTPVASPPSTSPPADPPANEDGGDISQFEQLWSFRTDGAATGQLTAKDGRVYAGTWLGNVYALDEATGQLVWKVENGVQVDASIVPWEDLVFFGDAKADLVALRAATGEEVWRVKVDHSRSAHLYSAPVIVPSPDGDLLVAPVGSDQESKRIHGDNPIDFRGSVVGYDPRTGEERWRTLIAEEGTTGAPVWGTPVVDTNTGILYFGTGNAYSEPAGNMSDAIVALNGRTGEILWSKQATKHDAFTQFSPGYPDDDFGSTGNLWRDDSGRLLFGIGQKSHVYWTLDALTGEVVWKNGLVTQGEGIIGASVYANGLIAVPYATQKRLGVLDAENGLKRWDVNMTGLLFSDPALIHDRYVVTGDGAGELRAFDLATGEEVWNATTGTAGGVYGGILVQNGRLYVPTVETKYTDPYGGILAFGVRTA